MNRGVLPFGLRWDAIPAVRNDRIVETKSPLILQPGPAALTDGLDSILAALGHRK
jgi:iron complex transport system substrate-binding protein